MIYQTSDEERTKEFSPVRAVMAKSRTMNPANPASPLCSVLDEERLFLLQQVLGSCLACAWMTRDRLAGQGMAYVHSEYELGCIESGKLTIGCSAQNPKPPGRNYAPQ